MEHIKEMEWMNFHNLNLYICFWTINKQKQYFVLCWRFKYSWNCMWYFYNVVKKSIKSNCKSRVIVFLKGWQLELQTNLIQYFQQHINYSNIVLTYWIYCIQASCMLIIIIHISWKVHITFHSFQRGVVALGTVKKCHKYITGRITTE